MLSAYAVHKSKTNPKTTSRKRQLHQKSSVIKNKKKKLINVHKTKENTESNVVTESKIATPITNVVENDITNNKHIKLTNAGIPAVAKMPKENKKTENKHRDIVTTKEIDADILKKPLDLLNYLLKPIKITDFFNTYWETKPVHIVRKRSDYFKNILSSEKLDAMLRENVLYYTKNVDVVTYEDGERQTHNPDGRAIPANIWDYYMNGCSVRIMNPQTYNAKIRDLLSSLQEYFGTMVGANIYLTPPGSQGFAPHYDDIEAFVLQLEGHKNWKLYGPRNVGEVLPRSSSHNLSRDELGTPIKELTLNAGDLLYFPRGVIHEASTDPEAHSLHITVSVYQNTAYVDLLERLLPQTLKQASERDVSFRKGLPLNYLKHVGLVNSDKKTPERKEVVAKVKELMCKLVDYALIDSAADQLGRKFMYEALPPQLSSSEKERSCKEDGDRLINGTVKNVASFDPDTMIRLTRFHSQRLVVEDGVAKIYYCTENANVYHGEEEQYLELDDTLIETIKKLQNSYPQYISIENLPCKDEIKKLQAISDLWEKGLIITKEPLQIEDE